MKARRFATLLSSMGALVLVAAACGPTPAAAPARPAAATSAPAGQMPAGQSTATSASPALQELIDGARRETALKVQWSPSSFGGAAGFDEIVAGMNQKYGLTIQG